MLYSKKFTKAGQDLMNVNCLKTKNVNVIVNHEGIKTFEKDYVEKLLIEENI